MIAKSDDDTWLDLPMLVAATRAMPPDRYLLYGPVTWWHWRAVGWHHCGFGYLPMAAARARHLCGPPEGGADSEVGPFAAVSGFLSVLTHVAAKAVVRATAPELTRLRRTELNATIYEDVWLGSAIHRYHVDASFLDLMKVQGCVGTRAHLLRWAAADGSPRVRNHTLALHFQGQRKQPAFLVDAERAALQNEQARVAAAAASGARAVREPWRPCSFDTLARNAVAPRPVKCTKRSMLGKKCWSGHGALDASYARQLSVTHDQLYRYTPM